MWDFRTRFQMALTTLKVKHVGPGRHADMHGLYLLRDCYDAMKDGWKDQRHAAWMSNFERHVFPHIGRKAVTAVDSAAVLSVLEPIWLTIPDTAKRVLQRISTVLDYAHIKGLVPEEVSLRSVTRGLPRQSRQVTHRAALPHEDTPAFVKALAALPSTLGRDALRLTVLTAARSNETSADTGDAAVSRSCWPSEGLAAHRYPL
jgi:hypothetical protein